MLKFVTFEIFIIYINYVIARPELPPPSSSSSSSSSSYQYNSIISSTQASSYLPPSSSSSSSAGASYGPPVQAPIIHKHVYVHVSPNEPEHQPARKPIVLPPPQKHYKIVFIKAPSPPIPTSPVIPIVPQSEEKTLVYVLVKKPDEQPDIIIPTLAPTQPSKPEVYFIRYKTQKQSVQSIESGGTYPNSISPLPSGDYGAPIDHSS
ncbi:ESCRT-I complex subunit tsg101-like isoform X2 [Condylostylus longicornis]|uniref:ESCRT-I complex subunit tsg101-like isoform X2 n=1 Tax=Condylostylus longicornis TaxID=2530218 RepID=UPI00244E0735|nr:ESCRT-I complex subunit tsg101-like isoform X2 [Condylostylus longicornis]